MCTAVRALPAVSLCSATHALPQLHNPDPTPSYPPSSPSSPPGACKDGQCVGGDDGCGIAQKRCGGVCKNIFVDNANCGNCGVACKK